MDPEAYSAALGALRRARETGSRLDTPFVEHFPVDGASVSTLGDLLGTETLFASDEVAARVDELQFDLGEGPSWQAVATAAVVCDVDIRTGSDPRWPMFREAVSRENVGTIYALPMVIGPLQLGAIDLYCHDSCTMDDGLLEQGESLARLVARDVFRRALRHAGRDPEQPDSEPLSRRIIHQATGMVLAQLSLSAADARLVIEGHAFAAGTTVMDIAQRIVDRELVLADPERSDADG